MAKKISEAWSQLPEETREELQRLKAKEKDERCEDILEQVRQLGHSPERFKKAETDEQKADNSLAEKITKAWAKLPEDTREELQRL